MIAELGETGATQSRGKSTCPLHKPLLTYLLKKLICQNILQYVLFKENVKLTVTFFL